MTYIITIITAILYARWISQYDRPIWFYTFLGLVWGLIAVYAVNA